MWVLLLVVLLGQASSRVRGNKHRECLANAAGCCRSTKKSTVDNNNPYLGVQWRLLLLILLLLPPNLMPSEYSLPGPTVSYFRRPGGAKARFPPCMCRNKRKAEHIPAFAVVCPPPPPVHVVFAETRERQQGLTAVLRTQVLSLEKLFIFPVSSHPRSAWTHLSRSCLSSLMHLLSVWYATRSSLSFFFIHAFFRLFLAETSFHSHSLHPDQRSRSAWS